MLGSFSGEALEVLDFVRCERPDGTAYGTAGTCRKGVESTIETKKYSWGSTMKVSGDGDSVVLHDENQSALGKLADGGSTNFKSDSGDMWKATRNGDTIELTSGSTKLTVSRSRFGQDEPDKAPKPEAKPKAKEAPKSSPKKPREEGFERGGTLKENPTMKSEFDKKVLDHIVANVPAGTVVKVSPLLGIETEFKTPGGNVVKTQFGRNSFNFEVNGTYEVGTVTQGRKEEMAIARQVQRCFKATLGAIPEGFVIRTHAYTEDGRGASRQRAYEKMGFSRSKPGENIYGRLENGALVPSTKEEQSKTDKILSFSENVGPYSFPLWYVAIFGKDPRVKPS